MSQDPSSSAPGSDPTAAPTPDSAYEPPPSWTPPASPTNPADERSAADPTQVIDTSAATRGDPAAPYDDPSAVPYGGYDPAQFGQPSATPSDGRYTAPGAGYTAPDPGGYAGYDSSGAGSNAHGAAGQPQADQGAAYGGYPGGYPAAGSPPAGYGTGYPPAGGYGGAGYPGYPQQPYGVAPPTNTMAILSLVFAFVFPPLGIVFGFVARGQIKRTGEQGEGLALAGLIISAVLTLLFVVPFVALIFVAIAAGTGSAV